MSSPPRQIHTARQAPPRHQERPEEPQITQHRKPARGCNPVYRRLFLLRGSVSTALEGFWHHAAQNEPTEAGGKHHEREGHGKEKQGDERRDREAYEQVVVEGASGDP